MTEERRSARVADLPDDEKNTLNVDCDTKAKRNCRARQLFEAGWTLRSIGEAFTPSYRRSTVKYWVEQGDYVHRINVPIPVPNVRPTGYQRKKPVSPGIPAPTQQRLAYLAPFARYYRSGMASTSIQAQSNREFNELIHELFAGNVTIAEIAKASNVTFRAIARRLGR